MAEKPRANEPTEVNIPSTEEGKIVATAVGEGFNPGQAPLKIVTGYQTTASLNFELKPGAIVAHPGSSVIFVCG